MQVTSMNFKARAGEKLADVKLQAALRKLQGNFVKGRADRITELDNFEDIRSAATAVRDRALAHLDVYLEEFEKNATARGAVVHWAETAEEAGDEKTDAHDLGPWLAIAEDYRRKPGIEPLMVVLTKRRRSITFATEISF